MSASLCQTSHVQPSPTLVMQLLSAANLIELVNLCSAGVVGPVPARAR